MTKTHKKTNTPTYQSWCSMKARCQNPASDNYNYYGGKGITICKEWLVFENFYRDMGDRPIETTLDRVDGNGNYCKENCRWATKEQQAQNKTDYKNNALKIKYVQKQYGKYKVRVKRDGRLLYLGSFHNLDEAILTRDAYLNQEAKNVSNIP